MASDAARSVKQRTLLMMRHAKSSWATGHGDHDRPLNARGRDDAPRIGQELGERGWLPELVLCSTSERTRETLAWVEQSVGRSLPTRFLDRLYLPSLGDVLELVSELPDALQSVMVLGHNPSSEEVVLRLSGDEIEITTANVVRLVAVGAWPELVARPCQWRVEGVLRPKEVS